MPPVSIDAVGLNNFATLPLRDAAWRDRLRLDVALRTAGIDMSAPRINGVIESCLYSTDLPRSVRFYQDKLGLRLIESGDHLCAFSVADKQVLLIFLSGGMMAPIQMEGGMIPPHDASGQLHFAFAISREDLPAWEKHLIAQGIPIESKVDWPTGGKSLYFRDPDNHLVEVATPGIWEVY